MPEKLNQQQKDLSFMSAAIKAARSNFGITSPNPTVGCVIVKNDQIIASGATAKGGRPHAESLAIEKAGYKCQDSTLYVTLEPCSHFGKTSPCAEKIIAAKFARVVIATIDPDPRVNGNGIKKLKHAGIEVEVGILESEAREINRGFFYAKQLCRPFVTLKLATSLDEKITNDDPKQKWITNQQSRDYAHYLRSINDAILVGANTVKKDDPMLNCRLPGLKDQSPKRIIISAAMDIGVNYQIIKTANQIPTFIATGKKITEANCKKFLDHGVKIIHCQDNQKGQIDLKDLLKKLTDLGINSLLVEGGSIVATEFIESELVDEIVWIRSKKIVGNNGLPALKGFSLMEIIKKQGFQKTSEQNFAGDILETYDKQQMT